MLSELTECLHQKLDAGCVCGHQRTNGRVDAHVRQHPDEFHQHIISLLGAYRRSGRLAGRTGTFLHGCVVFSLVVVVQPEECVHTAVALEEPQPRLVAFGCEVPKGEEEAHDEVLWMRNEDLTSIL